MTQPPGCSLNLLKPALFSLGPFKSFAVSYQDPKTPTKALLFVSARPIMIAEEEYK